VNGREVNTSCHFDNELVCILESLSGGTLPYAFIQALEAAETIFIPKIQLIGLSQNPSSPQQWVPLLHLTP
jgi:hypothetical protein